MSYPISRLYLPAFALATALLFPCATSPAQTTAGDRALSAQDQANYAGDTNAADSAFTSNGRAVATPNDPDLGVQEIIGQSDRYQPFSFSVGAPVYYTSNAALTRSDPKGDVFFAPAANLTYQPRFGPNLFGDFAVQQQFFFYNRFDELNFGDLDARAGLIYVVPQLHSLSIRLAYDYNRLTVDDSLNEELFADQNIILSGNLPFRFSDGQELSIGGGAKISVFGDPDAPRRDDFDLYLAYSIQATRSFSLSAVGRVVLREYVLTDRADVSESLSFAAVYRISKWLNASLYSTVAANQSNDKEFDYSVANLGGGLSFTIKF